ncbi:ornithine carbamoyltransferase [Roseiterribacter gracilis]|uniref:Ornithine carbamoyltransferase n=1 Tax=Roseiterribacter gracilis TaxID=2812848 RepID=A0A8S8X6Y0_9PROT|nr:ornithine carbamoyltransferase [Rhodospirillales bacterium TMPK1]
MTRHFLDIDQVSPATLRGVLDRAHALKRDDHSVRGTLANKAVALIFEKPSTRTRVSFERGVVQMGGQPIILDTSAMAIGHGESLADTARVLSRYVDAIVLRTSRHAKLLELAENATVPVINALTELSHPCQIMADIQTFEERRGPITGKKVAWIGDCNNVAKSWIHAAPALGFQLVFATPDELWCGSNAPGVSNVRDPAVAAADADAVITDVFVSMNDSDGERRRAALKGYQVDDALMARANKDAIFLHCLPARRGEEVAASVIDGPQSAVWDEAENRLHAQKAILAWCMGDQGAARA